MGIDIYASWTAITGDEKESQVTGFEVSARAGATGYLREAYHGGPYFTHVLVPEAFEEDKLEGTYESGYYGAEIASSTLAERLPEAMIVALWREATIYKETVARNLLMSIGIEPSAPTRDAEAYCVDLTENDGAVLTQLITRLAMNMDKPDTLDTDAFGTPETEKLMDAEWFYRASRESQSAGSVMAFVGLCQEKERVTGRPCRVYASY